MKSNWKHMRRRALSILLAAAMISPDVGNLVSYGAETVQNLPRYVSFTRPEALTLADVGLDAGGEDAGHSDSDTQTNDTSSEEDGSEYQEDSKEDVEEEDNLTDGDETSGESSEVDDGSEPEETEGSSETEPEKSEEAQQPSEEVPETDEETEAEEPETDEESRPEESEESEPEESQSEEETVPDETEESRPNDEQKPTEGETQEETEAEKPEKEEDSEKPESLPEETLPEDSLEEKEKLPEEEATPSELRMPENFYEPVIDEPDGTLVQFNDRYRTYEVGDHEYVTIVGGYSGLYRNEDGEIESIDNSLTEVSDESEVEIQGSAASRVRSRVAVQPVYQNGDSPVEILIPEKMNTAKGYMISDGEHTVEVRPTAGNFKNSAVSDNAIRYSDVFEDVDYQYTVLGDTIKEDIILMEPQERYEFSYKLVSNDLNFRKVEDQVVAYEDRVSEPVFVFQAPIMYDDDGQFSLDVDLSFDREENVVTITADREWLEEEDRAYPVRIDPDMSLVPSQDFHFAGVADDPDWRDTNLGESRMLVGFEADTGLGNNRLFVDISTDWEQVMARKEAIDAERPDDVGPGVEQVVFKAGVKTSSGMNRTVYELFAPEKDWDVDEITWNVMERDNLYHGLHSLGIPQTSPGENQYISFDITSTYNQWIADPSARHGLMMRTQVEGTEEDLGSVMWADVFGTGTDASVPPRLEVSWYGDLSDLDPDTMEVEDSTIEVLPGMLGTEPGFPTAEGVIAYGMTQTGATVEYQLMEEDSGEAVDEGTAEGEEEIQYPDFSLVDEDCINDSVRNGNWQSDAAMYGGELDLDTIYYYEATMTGHELEEDPDTGELAPTGPEVTSSTKETDRFLLYEVQVTDLLSRIAKHYGVSMEQIRRDNELSEQLTQEGTVLFIRNPETDEPYTYRIPEDQLERFLLESLLNGEDPRCVSFGEPVNTSTGSFSMSQTDVEMTELDGTFVITRSYGSTVPYFRGEFGYGWNSLVGEKIMVLEDGTIIYVRPDGKGLICERQEDGTYRAPDGYEYVLEPLSELSTKRTYTATPSEMEESEEETESLTEVLGLMETEVRDRVATDSELTANDTEAEGEPEARADEDGTIQAVPAAKGWKISEPDGTEKLFNAYGMLVEATNAKGHTTSYLYDDAWTLTEIITPSGKSFGVEQDERGKILGITLPDGGTFTYEYDDQENLIQVTNPEGGVRRYEYDDAHHMTAWYDEDGNQVVANTYDELGRVTTQTDALGNTMTFSYGEDATTVIDNRGNAIVYTLDDQKRNTKITYANGDVETTAYDENNRIASRTDANGVTTAYLYDENGNLLQEIRADGSQSEYTYHALALPLTATDYEGNTTTFTYDARGNLLTVTDGEGNRMSFGYDSLSRMTAMTDANGGTVTFRYDGDSPVPSSMTDGEGNTTVYTYDEMYRLLTETDGEGNTTAHEYNGNGWETAVTTADGGTTVYEFSAAGEVRAITDPMGVTTTFAYDAMHNIVSGTDALGHTLAYAYDANYNKVSETDARGNVTAYAFDERNRPVTTTDALGKEIRLTLDGAGNIVSQTDRRGNTTSYTYDEVLGLPVSMTDREGNVTGYSYDRNGNLTAIQYPDGSSVSYTYDGAGRMSSITAQNGLVTTLSYDGNGNIVRISDDESRIYQYTYDHNNQLVRTEDPLGNVTRYAYDGAGNQIRVTDANGNATAYGYDPVGRLTEVTDALNGTIHSQYDLNGRTLKSTDQNGHSTSYYYDVLGELLAQTDAEGNVTALEYDALGNVTTLTDALKGKSVFETDALSRTVKSIDPMGGIYLYEYDENGNLLTQTMPDGDTIRMTYDKENRMVSSKDEAGVITWYAYDSMGRVISANDSTGNKASYEYDAAGNLVKETDTIGREAAYEYDPFGRLVSATGTDGATTIYGYDALDRLTSVTLADGTVTTYEYDPVGNLIKTTEPGEAIYTYAYDAINRVTQEINPLGAVTSYAYDAKGNLTGSTDGEGNTTSYLYDAIDRLTQYTDGRGNSTSYEYDELSRLLSYTTPEGNREEYRYDALGNLLKWKDANGLITEYQYDVMGNLMKEISPMGAETSYTYDKHDERTSVTDAMGNVTAYQVDLNRQVTKMTAKNGGEYTYTYDAVHRLTDITTPLGLHTELTYDVADNVTQGIDNLGRTNTYTYDIMHRMTSSTNAKGGITTYGYDIRGNQNTVTDALGYTWNYTYDLVDQLTKSVDPEGKATEAVYNLTGQIASITRPGERTTSYTYDGNYNTTIVTDPKGYQYQFTYDKDNRQVGYENPLQETEAIAYDAGSRILGVTDRMGLTESYAYDPHGNVLSVTATNGLVTHFTYDILDRMIGVEMPSGLKTSYTYDEMGNLTSMTDPMLRTTTYTYDIEGNLTSITDPAGRTEQMTYDIAGRQLSYVSNGKNVIRYDYDTLNDLVEKSYEDADGNEVEEGVLYGYDVTGQRVSMMDRSGKSTYEYDGLGRITKVTTGSGETTAYEYGVNDRLSKLTYADGESVSYEYDKNDNLTKVTDRTGAETTYVYDAINRVTEIHRPNGVSTYNTYNARDQIVSMKNICDDCGWVISQYDYTYDDRGFITGEDAVESLYGYAWDDKHDGKHENWHDDKYPHGDKHTNKHEKDGEYHFQIIETKRSFTYDADGKLLTVSEDEDRQGHYDYEMTYDDMGNRTSYTKSRNGEVVESGEYTYNLSNQLVSAKLYDGKKHTTMEYTYDADGNLIAEDGTIGTDKVEKDYIYTVENRLKAVYDGDDLLVAMAYDGDGNRIFQLNYNLHTDDDWKGNSGNGNGNNKDNSGSGKSLWSMIVDFFTGGDEEESIAETAEAETMAEAESTERMNPEATPSTFKLNDNGNNGNNGNGGNGNHYGWESGDGEDPEPEDPDAGSTDEGENGSGNTNNTGGSQNQSGILFPEEGEVSELEDELIGMIKTSGHEKNYELIEYVNDVNRENAEVLMELNINGKMDTAYSYGNERLTVERFDGWTGYYTYDPRGSVSGVTGSDGYLWQSYRYDPFGDISFGKPQYNNVYAYNAESFNPNLDTIYLRARYYYTSTANFLSEDTYLGDISDPLTLNRYNYGKSSYLNYKDPSGNVVETAVDVISLIVSAIGFVKNPSWAGAGFLLWDIGSIIVPGIPGSYAGKALKAAGTVDDVSDTAKLIGKVDDVVGAAGIFITGAMIADAIEPVDPEFDRELNADNLDALANTINAGQRSSRYYMCVDPMIAAEAYKNELLDTLRLTDYATYMEVKKQLDFQEGLQKSLDEIKEDLGDSDVKTYTFDLDTDIPELQLFEEADKKEEEQVEDSGDLEGESETVTTNKGNEVDITPNKNHTSTTENPGVYGDKNSSVDILDENGNVKTRRWYDENGKAYRDVDMTNHGNPKNHPEWPHEHFWDWSSGRPIRK